MIYALEEEKKKAEKTKQNEYQHRKAYEEWIDQQEQNNDKNVRTVYLNGG